MAAKSKKKKRSLADRYTPQARAEALLRFNPERSTLAQGLADLDSELRSGTAVAESAAAGAKLSARLARPVIEGSSQRATQTVADTDARLAADLAALGPAAATIAGATKRDSQGTQRRLGESLAGNVAELARREVDAESGKHFAVANLRGRVAGEQGTLRNRLAEVSREEGAFLQGRIGDLTEGARGRSVTRRGQTLTAGQRAADRTSRENIAREKAAADAAKGKRAKPATPEKVESARSSITAAQSDARSLRNTRTREEALDMLRKGRAAVTLKNDKAGNPLPNPVKVPAIPRHKDLYARAAVEAIYDGQVSKETVARLHKLGIKVRDLELPTRTKPVSPVPKVPRIIF